MARTKQRTARPPVDGTGSHSTGQLPRSGTRVSLIAGHFQHLVRGGTLEIGDVQICLQDLGHAQLSEIVRESLYQVDRVGVVLDVK